MKKIYSMAKGYIDHWKELEALEPGVRFITEYYPIDGYGDRGFGLPDESSLAPEEKPDPLPGQPEGDEAEELPEFMYELIRGLYRIIHIRTGVPEAFRVPEPVGYDWADDVV
ncbi:MAG: hypothetical protein GY754_38240 [bacterium]|nr:hypothetical protein [bacterium]